MEFVGGEQDDKLDRRSEVDREGLRSKVRVGWEERRRPMYFSKRDSVAFEDPTLVYGRAAGLQWWCSWAVGSLGHAISTNSIAVQMGTCGENRG